MYLLIWTHVNPSKWKYGFLNREIGCRLIILCLLGVAFTRSTNVLNIYCMPGIFLGTEDTAVNKMGKMPLSDYLHVLSYNTELCFLPLSCIYHLINITSLSFLFKGPRNSVCFFPLLFRADTNSPSWNSTPFQSGDNVTISPSNPLL